MKIGIVYTSTTPELVENVEKELRRAVGTECEFLSYSDPSILSETIEHNQVTGTAAARLVGLYTQAIEHRVDVILNVCSSVGEVADAAQDLANYMGVPIVRIDELMCRQAVLSGKKIAVMATLSTTLNPTKNTLLRLARECGKKVELIDVLVENAFGAGQEEFKQKMCKTALEQAGAADVILLAQGSMSYCERELEALMHKPVYSSPAAGARAVREALLRKGALAS